MIKFLIFFTIFCSISSQKTIQEEDNLPNDNDKQILEYNMDIIKLNYETINTKSKVFGFTESSLNIREGIFGLGVFANKYIKKQVEIELCPSLLIPAISTIVYNKEDISNILIDYVYPSPLPNFKMIVTGMGMMYNHCNDANIGWKIVNLPEKISLNRKNRFNDFALLIFTIKDIQPGNNSSILFIYIYVTIFFLFFFFLF
jgi:hypothetical protein